MPTAKALKQAEAAGLDLVEVAPHAHPPVCRILDYGKFKYEQKKKARGKPKSTASVVKEIRVRPKIDTNDVDIKVRKAREFLDAGNKVQVTCLFRGREMAYKNLGRDVLDRVVELLADIAKVERLPRMEGRRMNLLLSRKTKAPVKATTGKPGTEGDVRAESVPEPGEPLISAEVAQTMEAKPEVSQAPEAKPETNPEKEA